MDYEFPSPPGVANPAAALADSLVGRLQGPQHCVEGATAPWSRPLSPLGAPRAQPRAPNPRRPSSCLPEGDVEGPHGRATHDSLPADALHGASRGTTLVVDPYPGRNDPRRQGSGLDPRPVEAAVEPEQVALGLPPGRDDTPHSAHPRCLCERQELLSQDFRRVGQSQMEATDGVWGTTRQKSQAIRRPPSRFSTLQMEFPCPGPFRGTRGSAPRSRRVLLTAV